MSDQSQSPPRPREGIELDHASKVHSMPKQKPGHSKQDYSTPKEFLAAVQKRFGFKRFDFDLAALRGNAVDNLGPADLYLGPDHSNAMCCDALSFNWSRAPSGNLWLNPRYADIAPWAEKCAASAWWESEKTKRGPGPASGRVIYFLVPASVGANWFAEHVDKKSLVLFPRPRLSFDGKNPYPKDLILACFGLKPGYECWRWKP
jgi:hypothetical protein